MRMRKENRSETVQNVERRNFYDRMTVYKAIGCAEFKSAIRFPTGSIVLPVFRRMHSSTVH